MSIAKFISSTFSAIVRRDELASSCEMTSKKIRDKVLPEYKNIQALFATIPFSSPEAKNIENDFRRKVGRPGLIKVTIEALENSVDQLAVIIELSESVFAEEEASAALTFKKATYLRLVAGIGFASDYALKLMNYMLAMEQRKQGASDDVCSFSKQEKEYIEEYFDAFAAAITAMLRNSKQIDKLIDSLPDVPVSELVEQSLTGTMGVSKIDPLQLNNLVIPIKVTVKWSPFYLIGTLIAAFQARSYKATEDEVQLLQMRRLHLTNLRTGQQDARLEKEIESLNSRIQLLDYELKTAKEKFGV